MIRISVAVIYCAYLILVKGESGNTANANIDGTTATSVLIAPALSTSVEPDVNSSPLPTDDVNVEVSSTPATPPLFENILSTLEERLTTTMELPLLQGERDKIMENTLEGLKRCKEQFRSNNLRSRYRLCVDRQVQAALKKARVLELRVLNPVGWNIGSRGELGRMLHIPGEIQNPAILDISKKIPGGDLI